MALVVVNRRNSDVTLLLQQPTLLQASHGNDAWFGGSSLRIKGNKTQPTSIYICSRLSFDIQAGDTITVRYKINGGSTDCSLVLGTGTTTISWNPNTDYVVSSSDNTVLAKWVY
jgi:hypothetical protein